MDPDATQILTTTGAFDVADTISAPTWEIEARERLATALDRFSGPLADLVARNANEGDTQILVADFLGYGLNYSKYGDLTTEYRTSGGSSDYGVLLDGELFALVEVKACGQGLDLRNLRQARGQATELGIVWVVLTNGRTWQVYHLGDGDPANTTLTLEVDLLDSTDPTATLDTLFHLTKEAVRHGRLAELHAWRGALAPAALAEALRSTDVINALRAELRARTGHKGHVGDADELVQTLGDAVIARGLVS